MKDAFEFLQQGGFVMIPIFGFSLLAGALFFERLWALRSRAVLPRDFLGLIERKLEAGKADEALTLCEGNQSPLSSIIASGLRYAGRSRDVIKEAFEEVGRLETARLNRFIEALGTIAAVTPLLGLLGTVIGMIDVFRAVVASAGQGMVNPADLANGIWAALLTTAAGLSVAIPTLLAYKFLIARTDRLSIELEEAILGLLDLLSGAPK